MKIAIISLVDPAQKKLATLSLLNKFNYAQRHGYAFIFETRTLDTGRPTSWSKFLMVQKYIKDFDWVFWTDVDSIILKPEVKLELYLKDTDDYINFVMPGITLDDDLFPDRRWKVQLNTSHFFVRNKPWSINVLNQCYGFSQFIDPDWKFDIGGKHAEEEGALNYYFENNSLDLNNVKILKRGSLYISEKGVNSNTFIVHFGGKNKLSRMQSFLFENKTKTML